MYLQEYANKIKSGEIVVSKWVKYEIERLLKLQKVDGMVYDTTKSNNMIKFIEEQLYFSNGKKAKLALFQKMIIETTFSFRYKFDDELEDFFNEVYIEMSRKQGKTEFMAFMNILDLFSSENRNQELYTCSLTTEQAKILIKAIESILDFSGKSKEFKFHKAYPQKIINKKNNAILNLVPGKYERLQSIKAPRITIDEIHLLKEDITAEAKKSQLHIKNSKLWYITTAGTTRDGLYDNMLATHTKLKKDKVLMSRILVFKFVMDDVTDTEENKNWQKCCPNLGNTFNFSDLQMEIDKAKTDYMAKISLLTTICGLPMNSAMNYFTLEHAQVSELPPDIFKNKYCVLGIDLAKSEDFLSCAIIYHDHGKNYIKMLNVMPSYARNYITIEKMKFYDKMIDKGFLIETIEERIDLKVFANMVIDVLNEHNLIPLVIGYDPYYAREFIEEMQSRYGKKISEAVRQGGLTLSEPMRDIRTDFEFNNMIFDCEVLSNSLLNVITRIDGNGNPIPDKKTSSQKIDPFMALLNAYLVMHRTAFTQYSYGFER